MTAVAIQATFKKDQTQWDGLADHVEDLIKNPHTPIIVVAICEVVAITERPQEGTHQPKIRIKQIERATEGDAIRVTEILNRVYNARTGRDDSQPTLFDGDPPQGAPEQPELVQSDWPGVDVDGGDAWANDGEQPPEQTAEADIDVEDIAHGGSPHEWKDEQPVDQTVTPKKRGGRRAKSDPPPATFQTAEGAPDLGDDPDGDNSPDGDVPWPGDVDHPDTAPEA